MQNRDIRNYPSVNDGKLKFALLEGNHHRIKIDKHTEFMERREQVQQQQVMSSQVTTILHEFKAHVSAKYPLEEMHVFGSTVRGGSRSDCDIDVFLRLPHLMRVIEEDVYDMANVLKEGVIV